MAPLRDPGGEDWKDIKDSGGKVRRRLVFSELEDRSRGSILDEKSRSVLLAWWTSGLVGALRIKLEEKEFNEENEFKDGALARLLAKTESTSCLVGRGGLVGVYHGVVGEELKRTRLGSGPKGS